MCLGESTTQGQYPAYLEQILNQRNIGIKFKAIDKGITSTNTGSIVSQLEANLSKYQPDLVVTMMGINDKGAHMPYEAPTASKGILFMRSLKVYKLARLLGLHLKTTYKAVSAFRQQTDKYTHLQSQSILNKGSLLPVHDVGYYVELGWMYNDQGKLTLAEEAFKQGIALNPNHPECYEGLGRTYILQSRPALAEKVFKRGIAVAANYSNCFDGLGQMYLKQGRPALAEEVFRRGIALNPQDFTCYTNLGKMYKDQGKIALLEETFKQGAILNSQYDGMYGLLASLYLEKGQNYLAQEYYHKANEFRMRRCNPATANNYRRLKEILDKRRIRLVCVQYPMRNLYPLVKIFGDDASDIIFVDNEKAFKDAVGRQGYKEYFVDMFGGDFGHCTPKGNRLLAENIANTILKEVFKK